MDVLQQQQPKGEMEMGMGGGVEPGVEKKLKFTVSVWGRQWSSARHKTETLKEFSAAVQHNARRLEYIEEDDSIQRLQLVHGDGSEPEDLDVDATLGDVMICMGEKQLVAIVSSTKSTHRNPPPSAIGATRPDIANLGTSSTTGITIAGTAAPIDDNVLVDTTSTVTNTTPGPKQGSYGHGQGNSLSTPSRASMVMGSSSHNHHVKMEQLGGRFGCHGSVGGSRVAMAGGQCGDRSTVASPAWSVGFESFASGFLPPLPVLQLENISQAVTYPSVAHARHPSPCREYNAAGAEDAMNVSTGGVVQNPEPNGSNGQVAMPEMENNDPDNVVVKGSSPKSANSTSSADHVNTAVNARTGDVMDSGIPNGGNELVFLVRRGSKKGVGPYQTLKMSDLSPNFDLTLAAAAKELGLSQTTLKKVCREFGVKRWPGREMRSLKRTIQGVEHTIAIEQGVDLEEAEYMQAGAQKLQQELDQLVHGTPSQHSSAVRSDIYRRLYNRGWRSTDHSSGGKYEARPSGLGPQSAKEASTGIMRVATPAVNKIPEGGMKNQQPKIEPVSNQYNKIADVHSKKGYRSDNKIQDVDIERLLRQRNPKRPRRKCTTRTAPEAAGRQGLRSSGCAIPRYSPPATGKIKVEGEEPDA